MRRHRLVLLFAACLCPPAAASDLNLSIESGGQSTVVVAPGAIVAYDVVGELSDALNQGLGMFSLDLSYDGGDLAQAATPASAPMNGFATPLGLNNPAGFGGTLVGGDLIQVGGLQNTIANMFAAAPIGSVALGVAAPGSPQVLVSGTLTAPMQVGTFTLSASNVMANAVALGETGDPFWKVDAAGQGSIATLQVEVVALASDVRTLSIAAPGTQTISLDAGLPSAGRGYFLLGSITGTSPGLTLSNGQVLPLNVDPYFTFTLTSPNTFPLANSLGSLDSQGQATASFTLPAGLRPEAAGLVIYHAFALTGPLDFASNAVAVVLSP